MSYLDYTEDELKALGAIRTAREIHQQPDSLQRTLAAIRNEATAIEGFLKPILSQPQLRIVLTGAGTSAFAGGSIAPQLSEILNKRIEAIATTDLVSNPLQYFQRNTPTLLVSFSRSGDSPESIAAVTLAEQLVVDCYQLAFTCNPGGKLHDRFTNDQRGLAILMPEETNDQGFAMTSSFTAMVMAALVVFSATDNIADRVQTVCAAVQDLIGKQNDKLQAMATTNFSRIVYLGSGGLQTLAAEAALKLLELTDGQVVATHDSTMGFRHGPITIVNDDSLVFVFMSNDPHTRKYDLDLLRKLRNDGEAGRVVAISAIADEVTDGDCIFIGGLNDARDIWLLFPYIVLAQLYAFHRALELNNTPDLPCASGQASRVVQGVTIHSLVARP